MKEDTLLKALTSITFYSSERQLWAKVGKNRRLSPNAVSIFGDASTVRKSLILRGLCFQKYAFIGSFQQIMDHKWRFLEQQLDYLENPVCVEAWARWVINSGGLAS